MRATFLFKSGAKVTLMVDEGTIRGLKDSWTNQLLGQLRRPDNQWIIRLDEVVAVWQEEAEEYGE